MDLETAQCRPCPFGTYSNGDNVESCTACPEGQTTSEEGNYHISHCRMSKEQFLSSVYFYRLILCLCFFYFWDCCVC